VPEAARTTAAGGRRRTPLDPYPEPRAETEGGDEKAYPPELGNDAIAVLDGRTFMFSDARGDVPAGSVGGLLHDDTRFVGRWELTVNGSPLAVLKSAAVDHYSAAFFLTNAGSDGLRANALSVRRLRFVGSGMSEQIGVFNATSEPVPLELRLACGSDFADLFEVKSAVRDRSASIRVTPDEANGTLELSYASDGFDAHTTVHATRTILFQGVGELAVGFVEPRIDEDSVTWQVELPPRHLLLTVLDVSLRTGGDLLEPVHGGFGESQPRVEGALTRWLESVPTLASGSALLDSVVGRTNLDLAALRITGEIAGEPYVLPAAGLPWFMTLFGRDTLITSIQTVWLGPELAHGALHLLGELQGTRVDEFRDEEPGKILHEVRHGELTKTGEKPHSPYYGTADATPLWLILLSEYWRSTGNDEFVRSRWQRLLAALSWCDEHGDRDGDGFVEYATRSSQGLGNQCWKDSWDGIQFADGSIPCLPLATAEIQGYVYDAKLRAAELARAIAGDDALAERLEREAANLRERFNTAFWSDERGGYYVVALDGDKRPVDSMTSNMGHLLWSGIVPDDRAAVVAHHLLSDRLFSGWGVRTLSRDDVGYNPIGYHTGTVWPHDNALVVLGLARYGFREEANRIVLAQLDAAAHSGFRLPEAFAGFERWISRFPVPYPTACSPQAWATGAPLSFVQAMLGLHARKGELRLDPVIPAEIGRIEIGRIEAFGKRWDVHAEGTSGTVRPAA
jgi:glycogen debranching enzyme